MAFRYVQTDGFVDLLAQLGASLLVSTYQANKLLAVRAQGQGLSVLVRTFDRPMGLAVDRRRLVIGTRNQIWTLRNAPDIAPRVEPAGRRSSTKWTCAPTCFCQFASTGFAEPGGLKSMVAKPRMRNPPPRLD